MMFKKQKIVLPSREELTPVEIKMIIKGVKQELKEHFRLVDDGELYINVYNKYGSDNQQANEIKDIKKWVNSLNNLLYQCKIWGIDKL